MHPAFLPCKMPDGDGLRSEQAGRLCVYLKARLLHVDRAAGELEGAKCPPRMRFHASGIFAVQNAGWRRLAL